MVSEIRLEIGCADVDKMVDFYVEVLGGSLVSDEDGFKIVQLANIEIALWKCENEDERGIGITFVTEDLKELVSNIKKEKIEVTEWDDCQMALSSDPEGNSFSVMEDAQE
jgi:catechol 2,3-dioxygenase-like lactoylglutathione lyase family enzyme